MNKQTDRRQRKSAGQYHMHRVKSRTARSRKKRRLTAVFRLLLMSFSLLLSLLAIHLLRITIIRLAQDKADSIS